MFAHGSASLQLFPVVWIFLRSLGVICYDRWVLSEGHKNYFKDWCLMNSQSTFLFLTYFNAMNYGHIIKRMQTKWLWITQFSKIWLYEYSWPSFKFCWMLIFSWIKLSWSSCSMWDKPWMTQSFLAISLWGVIFHTEGFYYSYVWSAVMWRILYGFLLMFSTGLTPLNDLLLSLLITFFIFMLGFWFYFI